MSFWDDDFYTDRSSGRRGSWKSLRSKRGGTAGNGGRGVGFGLDSGKGKLKLLLLVSLGSVFCGAALMLLIVSWLDEPRAEMAMADTPALSSIEGYHLGNDEKVVLAVEEVNPAVVSVIGSQTEVKKGQWEGGGSLGSGVVFEIRAGKAQIVTNNHVVEQAKFIEVVLVNGEHKKAEIVGRDMITDLAVLEVDASGIETAAEFGDSDKLKAGQTAIAIGNPLGLGYSQTITVGVISSPRRTIPVSLGNNGNFDWELDVIQTDAAINSGNSGGALVNLDGKVIGINSLKVSDMGVEGLGFAIPVNQVKPVLQSLMKDGEVKRPYMGVYTQDLNSSFIEADKLKLPDDVKSGVVVMKATGPAEKAGLKSNDVIVSLDGHSVGSTLALRKYLYYSKQIGDDLKVTFYRDGKKQSLHMVLEELHMEEQDK